MEESDGLRGSEAHLTSAAAFVEGGIQDSCDDACSICLEIFCDSDPSTVTECKHEFHLQCILEWCQRSSQCPMCWQSIGFKDPTSQELLEAVVRERRFKFNPSRNTTIFHHPSLGDFELQHFPVDATDADLEERIIQHLAAAAAMGRRHIARREGQRHRSSAQDRSQFVVLSNHPNLPPPPTSSTSLPEEHELIPSISTRPSVSPSPNNGTESFQQAPSHEVQTTEIPRTGNSRVSANREDRAGPSELQTLSDSIRTKFNALSMKYKESISKGTRGWKERWLSRNSTVSDISNEVRREVSAGIATVSRMMEPLEARDKDENGVPSLSNRVTTNSASEINNSQLMEVGGTSQVYTNSNTVSNPPAATTSGANQL